MYFIHYENTCIHSNLVKNFLKLNNKSEFMIDERGKGKVGLKYIRLVLLEQVKSRQLSQVKRNDPEVH